MVSPVSSAGPSVLPVHHDDVGPAGAAQHTQAAQGTTAAQPITDLRERELVHAYVRDLFSPHLKQMPRSATVAQENAVNAHNSELKALADSRANTLLSEGQNKADIEAVMRNAFALDRYATTGTALVGGVPFTAVVAAQFADPKVTSMPTDFLLGFIKDDKTKNDPVVRAATDGGVGGYEAHVPDEFFQRLFADAKENRFFLKPAENRLHSAIVASLAEKKLGALAEGLEDAKHIQAYLVGAVITNAIYVALVAGGYTEQAKAFEKWMVPLRNYIAGIVVAHWKHSAENSRHQRGEALLLGIKDAVPKDSVELERDWLDMYKAAQQGNVWSALGHGGERMADVVLSSSVNSLDALGKTLTSANSLIPGVIGLGATFAARSAAQQLASSAFSSPLKQAVAGRTVNTFGTGLAFGIWAFLASTTDKATSAVKNTVNGYRTSQKSGNAPGSASTADAVMRARIEADGETASLRRRPAPPDDLEAQERGGRGAFPLRIL
jgi:hypothetical protein